MNLEFNHYASEALDKARQDAASCHQRYTGSEHIMLGLLAGKESLAGRILADNAIDYKDFLYLVLLHICQEFRESLPFCPLLCSTDFLCVFLDHLVMVLLTVLSQSGELVGKVLLGGAHPTIDTYFGWFFHTF